jgi:RNA polymerase sigma-70 factor (ECF subfamily)
MAGSVDAFSSLAAGSAPRLYATARLILRDASLAEDATQEALVLAWRDLSALRDPARFQAWLYRVLVRQCYKLARRERRRVAVEGQVQPVGALDPGSQSVLHDELERGFARLSVDHRSVLVLHEYLGYTFQEIADTLGLPVGTVKSRLSRAMAAMRAALSAEGTAQPLKEGQLA